MIPPRKNSVSRRKEDNGQKGDGTRTTVLVFFPILPLPEARIFTHFGLPKERKFKFLKSSGTLSFLTCQFAWEQPKGSIRLHFFLNSQGWGGDCCFFLSELHFSGFLKTQNFPPEKPVLELSGNQQKAHLSQKFASSSPPLP